VERARSAWCVLRVALAAVLMAGCKHDAQLHGTLLLAGKGVPNASVVLGCPDGTRHVTSTSVAGEFRFEGLGPGVDDACTVEVNVTGSWIAPSLVGPRCGEHDARGQCTEAIFAFEVR
jgi:hypothetical protein